MDRRTILAVVLSLGIYYAWMVLRGPTAVEEPIAPVEPLEAALEAPRPSAAAIDAPPDLPVVEVPFEMCGATGRVSTEGGRLFDVTLPAHQAPFAVTALYQWVFGRATGGLRGPWQPYGNDPGPARLLSVDAQALTVGTGERGERPLPMWVVSAAPDRIELAGRSADGVEVTRRLLEQRKGDTCSITIEVDWKNVGTQAFQGKRWIGVHDHVLAGGSRYASLRQPSAFVDGGMVYGGALGAGCVRQGTHLTDDTPLFDLPGPVTWFGSSDRYFGMYLLTSDPELGQLALTRIGQGDAALDGVVWSAATSLAPGAVVSDAFRTYAGPNHYRALAAVSTDLTRVVDLGWFAFFGYPLLWLLRLFHDWVGNWGISIILLTVLVKVVFYPMTQKSFVSMQKMQEIQPKLAKIKEDFADDNAEQQRRTLEVMQKEGVNPVSGCLPTLIQMPVWIALYNVLLSSVELYHTEFLYLRDLTEPDPYCVLPICITFLMWFQQQLSTPTNMDPVQQQVMKWMPVIFGLMFFAFPSGLAVYVFVNVSLSILQQWWIKRTLKGGGDGVPAAAAAG